MSQAPEQRGCFFLQPYKNEVFAFMPQDSIIHFRNMTIDFFYNFFCSGLFYRLEA